MENIETNNVKIGERIRVSLEASKISQRRMAWDLNLKEATLNRYITGTREIPASVLANVAEYLGESAEYLLSGENPEKGTKESWKERAIKSEAALRKIRKALSDDSGKCV